MHVEVTPASHFIDNAATSPWKGVDAVASSAKEAKAKLSLTVFLMRGVVAVVIALALLAYLASGGASPAGMVARIQAHPKMVIIIALSFTISALSFKRTHTLMTLMLRRSWHMERYASKLGFYALFTWLPAPLFAIDYAVLRFGGHHRADMHLLYGCYVICLSIWWLLPWRAWILGRTREVGIE